MSVMTYGSMRHLTLGIEVVLADGRIWSGQSSLTKDNTGYALKDLFIGSEGTLGIITAATLKLFPNPPYTVTAWLGIASLEMGLQLLTRAKSLAGCHVFACELMSENGLELVSAYDPHLQSPLSSPWHILLELRGGDETFLHNALERIVCAMQEEGLTVLLASSHEQRARFWRIRERMSEAQKIRGRAIKFDLSVPLSELPKFLEDATEQAQRLISDCFVVAFGHLGDGSIHFDVCPSRAPDGQAKLLALEPVLTDALINRVQRIHGSMAAEHGIGRRKRDLLKRIKDPVALEMMRALKNALDPKGILNPGVML
jgi:FAD/FMN-containing dehydrogenase